MTRRRFLGSAAATGAAQTPPRAAENASNVLLLITDQQSAYALGDNGNRDLATPAMDSGKANASCLPTMGEHFRAHGFQTVYSGKWHLPKSFGPAQGFDQLCGGAALGATQGMQDLFREGIARPAGY